LGALTYSPVDGGWLSGRWRKGAAGVPTSSARPSARFDMSSPANQRKLDIVEELAQLAEQADMTLIEMAIAFVSYLPAADITLAQTSLIASMSSSLRE
jgi:aryl-alcohol dehydrogenase-like predicted oxidoreductase